MIQKCFSRADTCHFVIPWPFLDTSVVYWSNPAKKSEWVYFQICQNIPFRKRQNFGLCTLWKQYIIIKSSVETWQRVDINFGAQWIHQSMALLMDQPFPFWLIVIYLTNCSWNKEAINRKEQLREQSRTDTGFFFFGTDADSDFRE